jgi:hypothetical protein
MTRAARDSDCRRKMVLTFSRSYRGITTQNFVPTNNFLWEYKYRKKSVSMPFAKSREDRLWLEVLEIDFRDVFDGGSEE